MITARNRSLLLIWLGRLVVAVVAVVMLVRGWGAWCDPITDFGRELYVPWRLSHGDVLYRDIAYFNGPLSPYFNALIFRLLGASLQNLIAVNLLLCLLLFILIDRLWRILAGPFAAFLATLTFALLFAFAQFYFPNSADYANYNYVCPYSHEATHGLLLCFAALAAIASAARTGRRTPLLIAGFLLGLISLTKVEIFAAAVVSIPVGAILTLRAASTPRRQSLVTFAAFVLLALLPPLIALLLFSRAMPLADAFLALTTSYRAAFNPAVRHLKLYADLFGARNPLLRIVTTLQLLICCAALLLPAAGLSFIKRPLARRGILILCALYPAALLLAFWSRLNWLSLFRILPLATLLCALPIPQRPRLRDPATVLRFTLCLFALALLAKMLLNAAIYHYGFVLAMPAMLLFTTLLAVWLPQWIASLGGLAAPLRAAALSTLAAISLWYLLPHVPAAVSETVEPSAGPDSFRVHARGASVAAILPALQRLPPDATLAALPEGAMLNYLSRRTNPTGYIVALPPELAIFGESKILAAYQSHPPDYIVAVARDASEYATPWFGQDYAPALGAWIRTHYTPIAHFNGDPPLTLLQKNRRADGSPQRHVSPGS